MRSRLTWSLLCLAVVWLLYGHTLDYPFQFDDHIFLQDGNVLAGRWPAFVWPPVPRALIWLSYLPQVAWHADRPGLFRAVNLTLHGINGALLGWLLVRILVRTGQTGRGWAVPAATLLFLLHPLQSESVIYIYQRSTLLSLTFALLALHLGLGRRGRLDGLLLVGAMGAAVLSKEWTVVLPLLVWLERGLLEKDWKIDLPLVIGVLLSLSAAVMMLFSLAGDPTLGSGSPWEYARLQSLVWWKYLSLILLPWGQSIDHTVPLKNSATWVALAAAAGLALLGGLLVRLLRQFPAALFGLACFLLALLPTSSLIPAQDPIFEHRLYAPLAGLAILTAALLARLRQRRARLWKAISPAWAVLLAALAGLTLLRSGDWRSEEALWEAAVRIAPDSYRSRLNLGRLQMSSQADSAQQNLIRAIELRPELPLAFRSLAVLAAGQGDLEKAGKLLEQAILLEPGDAASYLARGRVRAQQLRYLEARRDFQKAIELAPEDPRGYLEQVRLESRFGFLGPGLSLLEGALQKWPDERELLRLRAEFLFRLQRWPEAAEAIRRALSSGSPGWQDLYLAGRIFQAQGNLPAARQYLDRSLQAAGSRQEQALSRQMLDRLPEP